MSGEASPVSLRTAVLIAGADDFELSYVATVLAARGVHVVGPVAAIDNALDAIGTAGLRAVIISHLYDSAARSRLVKAAKQSNVPYLLLARPPAPPLSDEAVLTRPYAAYQVADWLAGHCQT